MSKCSKCNKKNMLFDCKCSNKFCIQHLQPEVHDCKCINEFRKIAKEKNTNTCKRKTTKSIRYKILKYKVLL